MPSSNKVFQIKNRKGPVVAWITILILLNTILMSVYITLYFFCPFQLWIIFFLQLVCLQLTTPIMTNVMINAIGGAAFYNKIKNAHTKIINSVSVKDEDLPWVAIVVPVYNDFMPKEIAYTFKQNYPKIKRYILDDSTDEEMAKQIEIFAKKHDAVVLHSKNWRSNYYKKNGLSRAFDYFINQTKGEWDYMIHVDSGDILMHNHAINAIKIFLSNKIDNLGSVCVVYKAVKLNNKLQNLFGLLWGNSNTPIKLFSTTYADVMMPGAGIVYKKEAIYRVGEWPNTQCEDGAISTCLVKNGYRNIWTNVTAYGERQTLSLSSYFIRNYRISAGTYLMVKEKFLKLNPNKEIGTFSYMLEVFSTLLQPLLLFTFLFSPIAMCLIHVDFNDFSLDSHYVVLISCICVFGYITGYIGTCMASIFLLLRRRKYFIIPFFSIILSPLMPYIYLFAFIKVFIFNGAKKFIVTNKKMSSVEKDKKFFWFLFSLLLVILCILIFGSLYFPFYSAFNLSVFISFFAMLAIQISCLCIIGLTAFKKQDNSYPNNKIQLID